MIRLASDPTPWVKIPRQTTPNGLGYAQSMSPPASAPAGASDITREDWDLLFRAVRDRLRIAVRTLPVSGAQPLTLQSDASVRVLVLECVQALDQLHAALLLERKRCQQLEPGHAGSGGVATV